MAKGFEVGVLVVAHMITVFNGRKLELAINVDFSISPHHETYNG